MTFRSFFRPCAIVFFTIATFVTLNAQAPQVINYQAVVRDAAGEIVKNKAVNFRLSILDNGPSGTPQYVETQNKTTNQFGLVTFGIGQGTTVSGSMNAVTWATGNKFFKVELDINGGNNFSVMSTSQFLSVPYALYAPNGGSTAAGWGLSGNTATLTDKLGTNNAQDLRFVTNGSQKAVLTTDGKLGFGTNIPTQKLEIITNSEGNESDDGRFFLKLNNTSTGSASQGGLQMLAGGSSNVTTLSHVSPTYSIYSGFGDFGQLRSTGSGLVLQAPGSSGIIKFQTGGITERMRVASNGNVGIGTENPTTKLEVTNGDVYVNDATKGIILKSPNGNCWRVTIDNTGTMIRTAITCPN